MRAKWFLIALLGLLLPWAAAAQDAAEHGTWTNAHQGTAMPSEGLVDLSGHPAHLPDHGTVLVHFWATWCEPCLEELPRLAQLKVPVIAVSEDRAGADVVNAYLSRHPDLAKFTIVLDSGRHVARQLGIAMVPSSLVVKDGHEYRRLEGSGRWDEADLRVLNP